MGLLLGLLLLLLIPPRSLAWGERGMTRHAFEHDHQEREYYLREAPQKPEQYRGLVLALHGGGGTAKAFARSEGGRLEALALEEDFLVAYPQGIGRHWNDKRRWGRARRERAFRQDVDDVGFLSRLIRNLRTRFQIPRDRVFVSGISNGAKMTLRLLLERPELIRAAGVVTMGLDPDSIRELPFPDPPVPVAFYSGTDDPLVPYEGGEIRIGKLRRGKVLGARTSAEAFAKAYGCAPPHVEPIPDRDPQDGTTSKSYTWRAPTGAEVVLVQSLGGGHAWPGGTQYLPKFLIGRVVKDFHASEHLVRFWRNHGFSGEGNPGPPRARSAHRP